MRAYASIQFNSIHSLIPPTPHVICHFQFFIKLAFLIWLYHPSTLGAVVVYEKVIRPFILPYVGSEDDESSNKKSN